MHLLFCFFLFSVGICLLTRSGEFIEERRKFRIYGLRKEEVLKTSRGSDTNDEATLMKHKELNVASSMTAPSNDIKCSRKWGNTFGNFCTFPDNVRLDGTGDWTPISCHILTSSGNDKGNASLKPMKTLIAEEMSKETESRRRSPGIIARLMGLDALPANEGKPKQKRQSTKTWYGKTITEKQETASQTLLNADELFPAKGISNKVHPSQISDVGHHEFQDVSEVEDMPKVSQSSYLTLGNISGAVRAKIPESSDAFVMESSVAVKCPITDKKLWNSQDLNYVMHQVYSIRDSFWRTLPKPDLPFTKHIHNLQHVPFRLSSDCLTDLRSSRSKMRRQFSDKYDKNEMYWRSQRKSGGQVNVHQNSCRCTFSRNAPQRFYRRNRACPSHRLRKSLNDKSDNHLTPTKIVVLNLSDQNVLPEPIVLPPEVAFGSDWLFKDGVPSKQDSRESNMARQLNQNVDRRSLSMPSMPTTAFTMNDHSHNLSREDCLSDLVDAPCRCTSGLDNKLNSSPSCLMGSPVNLEKKKHLCHQCKAARRIGELKAVEPNYSALDETPSRPKFDTEEGTQFASLREMITEKSPSNNMAVEAAPMDWGQISDPREKDFRQEGYAINLFKPRSHSCSLTGCDLLTPPRRFASDDETVKDIIAREAISPRPGLHHDLSLACVRCTNDRIIVSEQQPLFTDSPVDTKQPEDFAFVGDLDSQSTYDDQRICVELEQSIDSTNLMKDDSLAASLDPHKLVVVSSPEHRVATPPPPLSEGLRNDAGCNYAHDKDNVQQPSLVSILKPPFEDEISSSVECFDRISSGLEGLHKQLPLFTMQSLEKDTEVSDFKSSRDDDFTDGMLCNLDKTEPREEENMEFLFLLDELLGAGFRGDQDILQSWFSPECPINPHLFEELDKKYSRNDTELYSVTAKDSIVSRLERRLLFDRINEGIKEVLKPSLQIHPWSKSQLMSSMPPTLKGGELLEKLWELLRNYEEDIHSSEAMVEDLVLDMMVRKDMRTVGQWLEFREDVNIIGREIEDFLIDDLIIEMLDELEAQ